MNRRGNDIDSFVVVAIDGGAASGKSSTARGLASRFHLLHADTGSYYRMLTHRLSELGVAPEEGPDLVAALNRIRLETKVENHAAVMMLDGRTPGPEIRGQEVNALVSRFAALAPVRKALLAYQRSQADVARRAGFQGLVMEGRDIGSVIFPDADVRVFLSADPGERERRRTREGLTDHIVERDRLDTGRKASPLSCPPGATAIDTTDLTLPEVIDRVAAEVRRALGAQA